MHKFNNLEEMKKFLLRQKLPHLKKKWIENSKNGREELQNFAPPQKQYQNPKKLAKIADSTISELWKLTK